MIKSKIMILQYEDKIPFGKYKGVTIVKLIFMDSSYLLWMSRNVKQWSLPDELKLNLEAYEELYEEDIYPNYDMLHPDWGDRD